MFDEQRTRRPGDRLTDSPHTSSAAAAALLRTDPRAGALLASARLPRGGRVASDALPRPRLAGQFTTVLRSPAGRLVPFHKRTA
jgi:hypothetical protein